PVIERVAPASPVPESRPAAAPVVPLRPAPALKTPQETVILVVDDSKMVRLKTSRLLATQGYQVVLASDGQDAVDQLRTLRPDLVITDVDMPRLDGFGLARHLRGDPRTAGTPVVMITSAEDRHRPEAAAIGVGLVLGKPYPEDALLAHVAGLRFPAAAPAAAEAIA
ncbi:MAG TPA: response regulator, partial [Burkholderiaceae bacterium]